MSAVFLVIYRGLFVKFTYQAGKKIYEVVARRDATPFTSEPQAWFEAHQHGLCPDHTEVVNAQHAERGARKEAA